MASNPNLGFKLFESQQYGESDLLFKDATQCLVHSSHMDYRSILGDRFYRYAEAVFNCTHSGRTAGKHIFSDIKINVSFIRDNVYIFVF